MTPDEFYAKLLTYRIPRIQVDEYFKFEFMTICDLDYDFRAAIFDIDESIYYEEIERAAERTFGWLSAA
jgi:hypothetical protein